MAVRPVITIQGDLDLIGPVMQKRLQKQFKSFQRPDYSKDEKAFASFCQGMEFKDFRDFYNSRTKSSYPYLIHKEPCLHTYWTGCSEVSTYVSSVKPMIDQWIDEATKMGGDDKLVIVFCITAEVRSKRSKIKMLSSKYESVEEYIVKDYRGKCNVTNLRLASADDARIAESFNSYSLEINRLALNNFLSRLSEVSNELRDKRIRTVHSDEVYSLICKKLSLSVCYEMIRDPLQASTRYTSVHDDLEFAITILSKKDDTPSWLTKLQKQEIKTWDYPNLTNTDISWKYLSNILDNNAHIIHIWTFLFVRRIHTLCGRGLVQEVYKCCIGTLHCTARLINLLKLSLPEGVFNSWAYMSCIECVESMMVKIDPEVLAKTASTTLVLVRAELWHYAWEKLRSIGLLCHLMPGSLSSLPNQELISTICSGITCDTSNGSKAEDLGARLVEVLQSKEKFKNAFMSLGEMVIGAFKHAGRRRMAFSIGTRMAEFHKGVGMVKEAEQLLCDVTSLHSVQHWPQLSSSAYSILAHCQQKLKQEDKEVNSLLVLVTTPKHDNSAHGPAQYMDQLIRIADRSKYQKLLSWEPLFELTSLSYVGGGKKVGGVRGGAYPNQYRKGEEIELKVDFRYSGPKEMKLTMVSVILEPETKVSMVSIATSKTPAFKGSLESLQEIELEPGPPEDVLLSFRPVGGDMGSKLHKVYYSSSELSGEEGIVKYNSVRLEMRGLVCQPGANNSTIVKGKISSSGNYNIQQIIMKAGALDFCLVVPSKTAKLHPLTILPDKVNVSIGLKPHQNVILSGIPVLCELEVNVEEDTVIQEGAELSLVAPPTVQVESIDGEPTVDYHQLLFTLPSLSSPTKHRCLPFDMTVSSLYQTMPTALGCHDGGSSVGGEDLLSWQFELEVYCNWLTPPHVARLPLMVHEPFSFSHRELSAGESTFLQITMVNSCPLPLLLEDSSLKAVFNLTLIGKDTNLPKIFYPGDSFSFIWQRPKAINSNNTTSAGGNVLVVTSATFRVYYYPQNYNLTNEKALSTLSRTAEYNFSLSNMETVYHLKAAVEPVLPLQPISLNQHVYIIYTISNITRGFRDSTHQPHSLQIHYAIQPDSTQWLIKMPKKGVVSAPGIANSSSFKVMAMPLEEGYLTIPTCSLMIERVDGGGGEGEGGGKRSLTSSQCYDTTLHQYIKVGSAGQPF